ncbi:MAG: nucleotidyl transferase AbiEii/AbiGii toxin family protein [Candidatus Marinimicrobia bacterium]|nr:nucleotidyl transferase AbiEii/AbiGii toxin family protein [Candidatus Neomarinimicrobiota bacterium]
MNALGELLALAGRQFAALGQPWALVGGLAVSVRCEPRFTRDVDIAVAVSSDAQAEALVNAFVAGGFRVQSVVEQTARHRLATVRLTGPRALEIEIMLDLLFASSGLEPDICAAAEAIEVFPGVHAPVASLGHLIALKLLARDDEARPQDAGDLRQLSARAAAGDWRVAAAAVELICARGFQRGKDLEAELQAQQKRAAAEHGRG